MKDLEQSGAAQRRQRILERLTAAPHGEPISASVLAQEFSVSRQIIVGDIALLRSAGSKIDATPRGYVLRRPSADVGCVHTVVCCHTAEEMADELNTIVDFGCTVCDVAVEHPIYGILTGELRLSSRYDVEIFNQRVKEADALPLSVLTEGVHVHTIRSPSEEIYEKVCHALAEKGYLKV